VALVECHRCRECGRIDIAYKEPTPDQLGALERERQRESN
jgi:hypothetical protein